MDTCGKHLIKAVNLGFVQLVVMETQFACIMES